MATDSISTFRPLWTYKATAEFLGVCERAIWQHVKDGKLKAVRMGNSVRIDPRDVEAFVQQAKEVA